MAKLTTPHRIALVFEYATLHGGERSMLACLDWIMREVRDLAFVAIAPGQGRLADAFQERGIELFPWKNDGTSQVRPDREQVENELVQAVQSSNAALVHANSLSMGRLTGRISDRLSIPTSAHVRDILNLSGAAMADLNRNRLLIAVSQATCDAHVARGMDPARVVVVRNGIDLNQFRPRPARGRLHHELHLADNARLIATIGQIGLRKGQDLLAAAAPDIVREVPNSHFLLIGERASTKDESRQFEQAIERRFVEQNLGAHLHRLGYRDEVPELLSEIDLVAHPAHQEPFGRVLLEAAACGVPVVATRVGGTAEIVVDGVTGLLIPPADPLALGMAVVRLLKNEVQRQEIGLAARAHAVDAFDVSRSARHLCQLWRSLV